MKIILTFSLFVLSTTILTGAPGYNNQADVLYNRSGNKCISEQQYEFKLQAERGIIWNEPTGKNEISSVNGSLINFQSLERGRRILERKYNLYT